MSAFAFYRLPYAQEYHVVRQDEGDPLVLRSLRELNNQRGFVIAPFVVSDDCQIVVISGKETSRQPIYSTSPCSEGSNMPMMDSTSQKEEQLASLLKGKDKKESLYPFTCFHDALLDGRFRKLVLARCERVDVNYPLDAEALFMEACRRYPRMFVTLFSTPQTGMWLVATPEILLGKSESSCQPSFFTMALAGTMRLEGELLQFDNPDRSGVQDIRWSQKNIQEQRLVATYIADTLKDFADDITEQGPYTTRAANLVHLRSDFTFVPKPYVGIGDMVEALHPTPAVCGLPKYSARTFILNHEPAPRLYYSGFCGPLDIEGVTRLYVSLRSMQLYSGYCSLYAGGGLLVDSVEEQEWQETEAKMQTMKQLLVRNS